MGSIVKSSLLIPILSYPRLNSSRSIGCTSWFSTITWNSSNVTIRAQPRLSQKTKGRKIPNAPDASPGRESSAIALRLQKRTTVARQWKRQWRRPPVRNVAASLGGGLSPDGSADTKALEPRFALNALQGEQIAAGDEMRCEHRLFISTKGTTDSHPAPRVPALGTLVVLRESSPARVARFLCG
jgi:hypothetical protein